MNRGGEISDSLPIDLIIEISSRLPAKSIARFRSLSKLWGSMLHLPYFTELFLTRSWARPRLLFALKRDGEREWSFFSSRQLQNPYEKPSHVVPAHFHVMFSKDMWPAYFLGPIAGLIYFSKLRISEKKGDNSVPVIFNPTTRQYASLPELFTRNGQSTIFLGFDPIDKQLKVLSMASPYSYDREDHSILTLGTGEISWRKIQCPLLHFPCSHKTICINGVLYYLAIYFETGETRNYIGAYVIICFNVRSEKYKFIETEERFHHGNEWINYKSKLGMIRFHYAGGVNTLELNIWVLEDVEKEEWLNYVYTLSANKLVDFRYVSIVGVTAAGEIVLSTKFTSKSFYVVYYNPEKNTLQHVEIRGFGEYYDENRHRVYTFVDYVEDLTVTDAKYLKSSQCLNIIRERPKLPKQRKVCNSAPSLKNKQPTTPMLNKYELLANLE